MIEKDPTSFGAYVPDLPGCVAVGKTEEEVLSLIRDAAEFHLRAMLEEGYAAPAPLSRAIDLEVSVS